MASASTAMTPAQIELIESLSQDDIPIKLRCAICSKLAVNAFRLPCCEQAICERCQQNLPTTCPVCEHSPLSAEDCLAHKGLRTTIKVFLRTEEKKKAAAEAKAAKETPPDTPIGTPVPIVHPTSVEEPKEDTVQAGEGDAPSKDAEAITAPMMSEENGEETKPEDNFEGAQSPEDVPQPSIEVRPSTIKSKLYSSIPIWTSVDHTQEIAPGQESAPGVEDVDEKDKRANLDAVAITGMPGVNSMGVAGGMMGMTDISGMSQMQQMQMMMAMQSGIPFGGVGFTMMGMPGMNMDPMMMQQMYSNGGMSGANINGMNGMMSGGGMRMNGMMGNMGMGGGYGQQAWNGSGHDNSNANDFGSNFQIRAGSGPSYNSYGQQGYGRGGLYGRGRGRGRGGFAGYGRGGYQNDFGHQNFPPPNFGLLNGHMNGQQEDPSQVNGMADGTAKSNPNLDEFGRDIRAKSEDGDAKPDPEAKSNDVEKDCPATTEERTNKDVVDNADSNINGQDSQYDQSYDQNGASYSQNCDQLYSGDQLYPNQSGGFSNNGNYSNNYGGGFGYGQPHAAFSGSQVVPIDVPINAPTGPKAMREGLSNTSVLNFRGRHGSFNRPHPRQFSGANGQEVGQASQSQSQSGEDGQRRERERSRSRSRNRHHRHRDERDEELDEDEKESERRRERRRRRREEAEAETTNGDDDANAENADTQAGEEADDRARSASPADSRKSFRPRRDKERSDRHRDSDRERDSGRHRDRGRDRHRDRDEKDRERSERHRERGDREVRQRDDRDRVDKSKHRSSRSHRDRSRSPRNDDSQRSSRRDRDDREEPRDSDRRDDRRDDRDKDRDSHRSRRGGRDSTHNSSSRPTEKPKDEIPVPPKGPRSMSIFDSKGSARGSVKEIRKTEAPKAPKKDIDPHAAEREARNRERLLKEAQKMAGLASLAGVPARKRDREEDRGGRRKRRGRGGFDGVDSGDDEEERIRRNERERESARR